MTVEKNQITIRSCNHNDLSTLVALGIRTFRETFEAVNTPANMKLYLDSTFSDEKFLKEMNEAGSKFFLAEENGKAVGFAKVRASKQPEALRGKRSLEIERIYTVREMIGRGVGPALMEACLSHARSQASETVWLGVWEHNLPAQRFYLKWGFTFFGSHVFMLGTDAQTDLLMKKEIS